MAFNLEGAKYSGVPRSLEKCWCELRAGLDLKKEKWICSFWISMVKLVQACPNFYHL